MLEDIYTRELVWSLIFIENTKKGEQDSILISRKLSSSLFCYDLIFLAYSTVTDLARLRGLSTSSPRCRVAK